MYIWHDEYKRRKHFQQSSNFLRYEKRYPRNCAVVRRSVGRPVFMQFIYHNNVLDNHINIYEQQKSSENLKVGKN